MDTIYALASGRLPAGVAVIRLSGPDAAESARMLCGGLPPPRFAALRTLRRPADRDVIDRGLVLWQPAPRSYTGEDIVEFHLHGGRTVVDCLFAALRDAGARLAEPGEFSRRAFANGKLDLTEIEGLADLLAAETEAQRRQALKLAGGALRGVGDTWRERITGLRAQLKARLDFSDEADAAEPLPDRFGSELIGLRTELSDALAAGLRAEIVRDGFKVALLGPPNAGKSSLLNALAQRDVAIVTAEPGTTRDIIEVTLDLQGHAVTLLDTAGLRQSGSEVERIGVERAKQAGRSADLVLWVECGRDKRVEFIPGLDDVPVAQLHSKSDLGPAPPGFDGLSLSALTGDGMGDLVAFLTRTAMRSAGTGDALLARRRQQEAVIDALRLMDRAHAETDEIAADLLRQAGDAIARLSGRIDIEHVLDRIFAEFCIGK